jgi:pyridoxal kinase
MTDRQAAGDRPPVILSIQSSVAYGHVGNSAATFPLMRMGVEVWPVLTVHFSNHTGYPSWRGPLLAATDVAEVVRGIEERGVRSSWTPSRRCAGTTRRRSTAATR